MVEAPKGINDTITIEVQRDGKSIPVKAPIIVTQVGEEWCANRLGSPSVLGKRYLCVTEVISPNPEGTGAITHYLTGEVLTTNGRRVNTGCGTEVLELKKPEDGKEFGIPTCCGMPMILQTPRPLPSSD